MSRIYEVKVIFYTFKILVLGPSGFTAEGDECYKLDTDQWINWSSAKSYCTSQGGYLAKLDTATKRESAKTYITSKINKYISKVYIQVYQIKYSKKEIRQI